MPKIFGREPAVIAALIATVLMYVNTVWLHWSDGQTAAVNAVIALALGAVAAAFVSVDKALPFLAGIAQAVVDLALAFGAHWSQGSILAFMAAVNAFLAFVGVRPHVVASVPPRKVVPGKLVS
jgi:hypothetical protein